MPYQPRSCAVCATTYQPTSSSQKVCLGCKDEHKRQKNIAHLRALRAKAGCTPIGTVLNCSDCGEDYVYKSGPQIRCQSCQRTSEVRRIHEWLASDKERLKKYTDKAKDNYSFGGNRRLALERDKYTCQHCGTNDDLQVHHIDGNGVTSPRETRNNDMSNLLTLCRGCHTRVHTHLRHSS